MRVLLAEDYSSLRKSIVECLSEEGFAVDSTASGEEALWYVESHEYDVVILDIMLPERSGLEVLKKYRESGSNVPVILISARDTVNQRIEGLEMGADDYLIKPFALAELVARVRAQVRRRHELKPPKVTLGDIVIDLPTKSVFRDGAEVHLTRKEYRLLECLVAKRGEVVSREYIYQHAYDDYEGGSSNIVDVYIGYLRKKLNANGLPNVIVTKRGHGYFILDK